MSSNRIILRKRQPIFMAHICSNCGCPVVSAVIINVEVQKSYTTFRSKAETIAKETMNQAIKDEIRRIQMCKTRKKTLFWKKDESSMISPGHFCTTLLEGIEYSCPFCSNVEPWKPVKGALFSMDSIAEENFPVVFNDAESAEAWAIEIVRNQIDENEVHRNNKDECEKAQVEAVRLYYKIKEYKMLLDAIPELKQKKEFERLKENLEKQSEKIGLLDFKRKKQYSNELKEIDSKIRVVTEIIREKQRDLNDKIDLEKAKQYRLKAIGFGCSGEIYTRRFDNTFSFYMDVYDIPYELLEQKDFLDEVSIDNQNCETEVDEKMEEVVFCSKCGFKLMPESAFCSKCGSRIN